MSALRGLIKGSIWAREYPPIKVDEKFREAAIMQGHKIRGNVRLAMGRFYTDEEWEKKRKKVLRMKLP